jgi:nitrite reductase (NADH) small subunit
MPEFSNIAKTGDIPEGEGRAYAVNGRMVAVFNTDKGFFAIDDFCPHMGASLAAGYVEDGLVTCPWHAWQFCVNDGTWCDNPKLKVDCFELKLDGDDILVCVPPKESPFASDPPDESPTA